MHTDKALGFFRRQRSVHCEFCKSCASTWLAFRKVYCNFKSCSVFFSLEPDSSIGCRWHDVKSVAMPDALVWTKPVIFSFMIGLHVHVSDFFKTSYPPACLSIISHLINCFN